MTEIVKIPQERIKILIGEAGHNKKLIETKCKVKLEIDSEGDVEIEGDTTEEFFAKDVVKAIGRGFGMKESLMLIEQDYNLYIISLKDFVNSDKAITRLKGRVIGESGKMKNDIELATESYLSIYGSTIGIIARLDTLEYAKEAVSMLLDGAPHSTVINYLAKAKREILDGHLKMR
ncbi:MAG: KH domain-containing protein [Candidatus Bilamarchaeum sp.]|jgi:ribosomal RNA assembly protein